MALLQCSNDLASSVLLVSVSLALHSNGCDLCVSSQTFWVIAGSRCTVWWKLHTVFLRHIKHFYRSGSTRERLSLDVLHCTAERRRVSKEQCRLSYSGNSKIACVPRNGCTVHAPDCWRIC